MRFEAEHVVGGIEERVFDHHAVAVDDVDAVVVPVRVRLHVDVVHIDVLALVVGLVPAGRVTQRDAGDRDVRALAEVDVFRAVRLVGAVQFQRVFINAALDVLYHVVGGFETLAVDGTLAGDADVLLFHGEHHGHPAYIRVFHVVERVGRAEQHGAALEVQRHVAFQVDRAGEVLAGAEDEASAAAFVHRVDRALDRTRVQGDAVGLGAEVRNLVVLGRELRGAAQQGDG